MEVFGEDLLEDVVFKPVGYYWSGGVSARLYWSWALSWVVAWTYLAFSSCAARKAKRWRSAFLRSSGSWVAILS